MDRNTKLEKRLQEAELGKHICLGCYHLGKDCGTHVWSMYK